MSHPNSNMAGIGAKDDLNFEDLSYEIFVKNATSFCPTPKRMSEDKLKRLILIVLTEKVSQNTQHRLDFLI